MIIEVFSRINLRLGYYQIWIAEGDEEKTIRHIRSNLYELLVMPFGLTNAPTTFRTFMNDIFWEWFDDFVIIYIDDILVYNNFMEEHVEQLRRVFQRLRENKLYAKFEKCKFGWRKWIFLDIRSPNKAWKWMITRWRQFWIGSHLGQC